MQNNNKDFEEDIENFNKSENDKIEIDRKNFIINQNLEYLNYINKLKSPNYNAIISEVYQEIDLEEDNDDNNEVDEIKASMLNEILKKLPDNKISKEKKKKGNKPVKDGMGLLLSLDVTEPALLYHSYYNYSTPNNKFFEVYLYSINISAIEQNPNYGFIFPIDFGKKYRIKLYNRKSRKITYAEIIKEKKFELNWHQMMDVLTFHLSICSQLIRAKKNVDVNNLKYFEETLYKNGKYKKYFFVPIFKKDGIMEIDGLKIDKCINFLNQNFDEDLFQRISNIISPNNTKTKNKEIMEDLKNCFLITDYRPSKVYKFEDIIYKKDNIKTFINKYTFNNDELKEGIKVKLKECFDKYCKSNINNNNSKFLMEELCFTEEEEQDKFKEMFGGITGYRKIPERYNISINNNNSYYLSCKFGPSNFCKQTNFIYNINILKTNIENTNELSLNKKEKEINQNEIEKYSKILPPDRVFCFYIEQNDIDTFEYIPSIFMNLEEILKVSQFIKDNDLTKDKKPKEKAYIEKNYPFLQWAFTLHSYVQDFNYESLETLGDSILKMFATTLVYHINELNDIETNVDKLVFGRRTLICNLHLYNKGKKSKIYNYIIRYPKEITSYSFPLEHENIVTGIINISEKIVADIIESSIGGMFLLTKNLKDIFKYIIKLNIPYVEQDDYKFNETKGRFAKDSIWKNKREYKDLVSQSYNIMNKKLETIDKFIFPSKISDLIDEKDEIKNSINLLNLMEKYLLKCIHNKKSFVGDDKSLEYLQKCRIFYTFKNKNLLKQAMTHKSKDFSNSKNYEKLELLGDSIVEIFISQYTFCIFSPYLFDDPNENDESYTEKKLDTLNKYEKLIKKNAIIFNNKYMTHVKSYLCSNYFMCKLSILIGLPNYIQFNDNNINMKNQLNQFLEQKNISSFLESPLNNYISTETYQPKFIADLFEALIGAIYIDSDLKTTFEFLHLIYAPSICYSCLYLEELPFSIVADFTEKCEKELKIVPSFKNVTKEEIIKSGLEYNSNKHYLKLTIGNLFSVIDMGDSEEKAKENVSEKGMIFLSEN